MKNLSTRRDMSARIAERVAQSVGPRKYSMWFDRTCRFDVDQADRRLEIKVPSRFVADWITRHFESDLRSAAEPELGNGFTLQLSVHPELFDESDIPGHRRSAKKSHGNTPSLFEPDGGSPDARPATDPGSLAGSLPQPSRHGGPSAPGAPLGHPRAILQLRHRLEDFIIGTNNELAFAAANRIVADDQSPTHPLFIHGGCGLGKTHLLQGICRRMQERRPDARIYYCTGEQFTNEFLAGVRANRLEEFRRRIRNLDLLVVDDVHFIANKEKTQQEFLHSFDAIELGGARVVLASDCHPKLIQQFSDALVSRCIRGMVVEIRQPDTSTRIKLIRALSDRRGMSLIDSVVEMLASRCRGSIRELEGTLTKLHALASLNAIRPRPDAAATADASSSAGGSIGHAILNRLFETEGQTPSNRAITPDRILDAVTARMNITRSIILGNSKQAHAVLARSVFVHLARTMTPMSYPEIASAIGKKNHSTVITAAKRLEKQIETKQEVTLPGSLETLAISELVEQVRHAAKRG